MSNKADSVVQDNKISLKSVKGVVMEMGVALAEGGYVWPNKLRTAFNKAVKQLEKKDIPLYFLVLL